jgi:cytochrome c peroxidase
MKWQIGGAFFSVLILLTAAVSFAAGIQAPASVKDDYKPPIEIPFPDDNPYSVAKVALGRRLFFDPIFSSSRSISCGSCHEPDKSWGDGRAKAHGEKDLALRSPTLLNVAWTPRLGWDGKFRNIEAVAFTPITSPAAMNLKEGELIERLHGEPDYARAFAGVFQDGITRRNIELALATYERTIVSGEGPFDRWIAGDEGAIDAAAKRGFEIFNGKGRCASCHSGWAFTDGSFHDIGTAQSNDIGRGRLFPTSEKLRYAFKTPTLRDVARRAPYMHDGSVPTLAAVLDLYDRGGIERPSRSELIKPLALTATEKADLVAFLQTLNASAPLPH